MKLIPNLGPAARLLYVVIGAGLVALAVLAPFLRGPWPLVAGLAGAVIMAEGAAGF